jgi:integrase
MKATYPGITDLASVRRQHCESYVSYLVEHGRFVKQINYTRDVGRVRKKTRAVSYKTDLRLSPKTIRSIVSVCHWVFRRLEEDAGITRDPWKDVILPQGDKVSREIFTPEELQKIWNGMQQDAFCYPLFLVAANSGMTEGDICTLQWSEVDWVRNCIRRDRRKTGADIILPLLPQLADYLASLPKEGQYVFPEHAELYLSRRSAVPRKVIAFLQSLGIETKKKVPGRRAVSVKDLHSMRHVFCYMATRAGIPRSSIAKMVGHMDEKMTAHYAAHETAADLNEEIRKLSSPFSFGEGESSMPFRRQLAELAYLLPENTVRQLVESLTASTVTGNCQRLLV